MTREVTLYQQCFGPLRGPILLLLNVLVPSHVGPRAVKGRVPGSSRQLLLRLGTTDMSVFKSIFYDREYDWALSIPPKVIIDGGAYTGLTAAWFAERYPEASIIAVEPSASNFKLLQENTADLPNVVPHRAAIWEHAGVLMVTDPGSGAWAFRVEQHVEGRETCFSNNHEECVEAVTVDGLLREHLIDRVDLLKLDIEGSEIEVFSGSSSWIEAVDAICLELHDRFRPGCSRAFFSAVRDFPVEVRRGENVLVVRDDRQLNR